MRKERYKINPIGEQLRDIIETSVVAVRQNNKAGRRIPSKFLAGTEHSLQEFGIL